MTKQLQDIATAYEHTLFETEQALQKARKYIYYISILRLVLFVGAVVAAFYFWPDSRWCLFVFSVLPMLLFVWLIKLHNLWFQKRDYLQKKMEINRQELRALQYDYSDFDGGSEYICPEHLYTFDLDVFGRRSLFQYINRTSTPSGKQHLAEWFNAHLKKKEAIEQRQEAIRELSLDRNFCQQIRLAGLLYKGEPADTHEIRQWADTPCHYWQHTLLRLLPAIGLTVNAISIGLAVFQLLPATFAGGVFTGILLLSTFFSKGITRLQTTYSRKLRILSTYAEQMQLAEEKEMHSPALQQLKTELTGCQQTASSAVRQLSKLMNALDQRNNLLISLLLNGLFFWELRQMMKIEAWKASHAARLPHWIEAIGEIDAYCSLATFAYNHPDYIFPHISRQPFHLRATALGHPLMKREQCVRNDIHIGQRPFFVIITGANMAGKSTYLRTIGGNYLLACIGAPVWAAEMEIYPAQLITSLRTSDSLTDNESYFFAELKRLQLVIRRLEAKEELFIVLDEILKGTNSTDKQKGSLALVKQFMHMNTNGIIATHDLLLGTLADAYPDHIRNFCFEADITNNELTFSYRMREGVAQNMNACFLMKKMGIAIAD